MARAPHPATSARDLILDIDAEALRSSSPGDRTHDCAVLAGE